MAEWRTLAVAMGTGLACACTLLVDTSGLGPGATGGADANDGDARSPTDPPGVDGTAASDAPPPPPPSCGDPTRAFCDDFDQGAIGARWDDTRQTNGAFALDNAGAARSPPFALRASASGSGEVDLTLSKSVPSGTTHLRCELDLDAQAPPPNVGEIDYIAFVTVLGGASTYQLYFYFQGGWAIGEYAPSLSLDRNAAIVAMPVDQWVHVVFETDGKQLTLTVNGTTLAQLAGLTHPAGTVTDIEIGLPYAKGRAPYTALFDDLACSFDP